MEGSSLAFPQEFSALVANLLLKFPEKIVIVLAYRIQETGNQKIAARLRTRKKTRDQFAGAGAIPFRAREPRGIKKRALRFPPIQQTLLIQAVEGRHNSRIGERPAQLFGYDSHTAFPARPYNFHDAHFQMAQWR
jgi:hypothetical protein